jgi:transcriptional regulator with XRE-family HTH domain
MFDLKAFREASNYPTQKEFADLIGVRQDKISRLEKNPNSIGLDILKKIADATGTTIDELVGYVKPIPKALEVKGDWESIYDLKKRLLNDLDDLQDKNYLLDVHLEQGETFKTFIHKSLIKPKIAFVGFSDAGKSTMINTLLGKEYMPVSWTPTTAISVHIKHLDDKPDFIDDDMWVLKSSVDHQGMWDPNRIKDEEYMKQWYMDKGHITDLEKFAKRGMEGYGLAGTAIIYLESPILKLCDLVDLPGFGTGDRDLDDCLSGNALRYADALVYLSISNGFLRGHDILFLKNAINQVMPIASRENVIEPLGNIFIVASQAHVLNRNEDLQYVLDEGSKRLYGLIPEEVWVDRSEVTGASYTLESVRKRFFTYTKDVDGLRKDFEIALTSFLDSYPQMLRSGFEMALKAYRQSESEELSNQIDRYEDILNQRETYMQLIHNLEVGKQKRNEAHSVLKEKIGQKLNDLRLESKHLFRQQFNVLICEESIVSIIETKKYERSKEDMNLLSSYLTSKLQAQMQQVIKAKARILAEEVNQYLADFQTLTQENMIVEGNVDSSSYHNAFDAERAFIGGLAGLATYGGLAVWASSLGNLGAYILVAKGVSLLSVLGLSISGGTASAVAMVSSIGGPVVLGVVLGLMAVFSVFTMLSGTWKKSTASKFVKSYEEQNVLGKFENEIDLYWRDTETAFLVASSQMETSYEEYVERLKQMVNEDDSSEIQMNIESAKIIQRFFDESM